MVTGTTGKRQRRSRQREIILEELGRLTSHPRGDELYTLVRKRLPSISLGTVYRNLNELQREGLALEIYCGGYVRYDGNVASHDHTLCRRCHRVWDFGAGNDQHDTHELRSTDEDGFQIEGQYTIFFGICPQCRETSNDDPSQLEFEIGRSSR